MQNDEALWRAIEAAGPLDLEASSLDALPGDTFDEWSERRRSQSDRRRSFLAFYAWSVPSREAVAAIAAFVGPRRLLEVCAGAGLWSHLLEGAAVGVVATDGAGLPESYRPIEALEAEAAVLSYAECEALLLCWPPFQDDCAFRALSAFAGDRVIYVGDVSFTAEARFHDLLARQWLLVSTLLLPSWPGTDDRAYLYERKTT